MITAANLKYCKNATWPIVCTVPRSINKILQSVLSAEMNLSLKIRNRAPIKARHRNNLLPSSISGVRSHKQCNGCDKGYYIFHTISEAATSEASIILLEKP